MLNRDSKVIFISYSHKDSLHFAKELSKSLRKKGFSVFLDVEDIVAGDNWHERLNQALMDATHLVAILSPGSVTSDWCKREWDVAQEQGLPIIPIHYISCLVEGFIGRLQYVNFSQYQLHHQESDYQQALEELVRGIISHGRKLQAPIRLWRRFPIMNLAADPDKLECIPKNTTIAEAFNIVANRWRFRYRHLTITHNGKHGERLLGVVGLRNLQEEISNGNARKSVESIMVAYNPEKPNSETCVWLNEKSTLENALIAFTKPIIRDGGAIYYFHMSAIPIVDDDFNAVSIVSFKDILNAMLHGFIPMPPITTISEIDYLKGNDLVTCSGDDDPTTIRVEMRFREFGQRDVPVVENSRLIGLVPDHILITNCNNGKKIGEISIPVHSLKLQTNKSRLEDMLKEYLDHDNAKIFYSFPVVRSKEEPQLLGLIGYRHIFQALLDLG